MAKDGDGRIIKMNSSGQAGRDSIFVKGLNAPKGLVIYNGILYAADVDQIKGFDILTGIQKFTLDFSSEGAETIGD